MIKKIFFSLVGLVFIGANVFAAGDLIVNGKFGVGTNPAYPVHIMSTDQPTALRLEPTINIVSTLSNYAGLYRIVAGGTNMTIGKFTGFSGNVSLNGSGTVTSLQGAENNLVFNSTASSTVANGIGNKVELRQATTNTASHTLTNYYGFWSYGNAPGFGKINGTNWRHAYFEDFPAFGVNTVANVSGLWVDKQTRGTNNYGIVLNGDGAGSDIVFGPDQGARIYSEGGYLKAQDVQGNITQFSPHDPATGEWIYYSKNIKTGKTVRVNMEKLVKAIEKLTGETFMIESIETK